MKTQRRSPLCGEIVTTSCVVGTHHRSLRTSQRALHAARRTNRLARGAARLQIVLRQRPSQQRSPLKKANPQSQRQGADVVVGWVSATDLRLQIPFKLSKAALPMYTKLILKSKEGERTDREKEKKEKQPNKTGQTHMSLGTITRSEIFGNRCKCFLFLFSLFYLLFSSTLVSLIITDDISFSMEYVQTLYLSGIFSSHLRKMLLLFFTPSYQDLFWKGRTERSCSSESNTQFNVITLKTF